MGETRYMTPDGKAREMAAYAAVVAEGRFTRDDEWEGGVGYPDEDMVLWCARLNAIPGVCTVQSCAGHQMRDPSNGTPWEYPAQLWLWLDEPTARAFDARAFDLATHPLVERVRRLYQPYGREIIDIQCHGNERSRLALSMTAVCEFFESLASPSPEPGGARDA